MPHLKKEDVIAQLKELNVEFDETASYHDLLKLLNEQGEKKPLVEAEEKIVLEAEGVEEKKAVEEVKRSTPSFPSTIKLLCPRKPMRCVRN